MFIIDLMKEFFKTILRPDLIRSTWRRVIHLWKPMAAWTILVWGLIATILAPISSAVLGIEFFRSGQLVIGNEQLISWLLSPAGVGYILLGTTLTLTGWILRFAGIFQIVADDINKQSVEFRHIIFRILSKTHLLFRLCFFIVATGLLLLLPLAAGLALIYELLLDSYDINYYLSTTPSEWHIAIIISATWLLCWMSGVVYLTRRFLFALPTYLHSQKTIRESLRYAWHIGPQKLNPHLRPILSAISFWVIFRFIADLILFTVSFGLINWVGDFTNSLRIVALATGIYVIASLSLDALISFLGFSHVTTLITKVYFQDFQQVNTASAPLSRNKFRKLGSIFKNIFRPTLILPIAGAVILISIGLSSYMIEHIPETKNSQVKIVAHRAGPAPAPENTPHALDLTMKTKAEWTEIDVRLSKDSTIVVTHDFDLMRIANSPAPISDTNYNHIQQILKNAYSTGNTSHQQLHTLDDFLTATKGNIGLMIELKKPTQALARKVIGAIRAKNMVNDVVLMSMDLDVIRLIQNIAPDITIGYISAFSIGDKSQLPVNLLAVHHRVISSSLINKTEQQGIEIYAWTVNRVNTMANMIEYNVDGIITDKPKLAVRIREELQKLSATERLLLQFNQLIDISK